MSKGWKLCQECNRWRERCIPAVQRIDKTIDYVCRPCWRDLDYDQYLYLHRQPTVDTQP